MIAAKGHNLIFDRLKVLPNGIFFRGFDSFQFVFLLGVHDVAGDKIRDQRDRDGGDKAHGKGGEEESVFKTHF